MDNQNASPERVIRLGDVRIAIFNHDGFRTAAVECRYPKPAGGRAVTAATRSWSAANLILLAKAAEWAAQAILMAEDEERQLQGKMHD